LLEIVAFVFVCLSILILFAGTGDKLAAFAGIVLCGVPAVGIAVRLRRRLRSTTKP